MCDLLGSAFSLFKEEMVSIFCIPLLQWFLNTEVLPVPGAFSVGLFTSSKVLLEIGATGHCELGSLRKC